MGTWMPDITKKPMLAQKIKFGHDASDVHLYWADCGWCSYLGMLGNIAIGV